MSYFIYISHQIEFWYMRKNAPYAAKLQFSVRTKSRTHFAHMCARFWNAINTDIELQINNFSICYSLTCLNTRPAMLRNTPQLKNMEMTSFAPEEFFREAKLVSPDSYWDTCTDLEFSYKTRLELSSVERNKSITPKSRVILVYCQSLVMLTASIAKQN